MKIADHSGVDSKEYPCSGNQMPCSQMISMNCSPPRATAELRLARLPKAKGAMRNSRKSSIGRAARRSTTTKSGE